jgi:hypothetical protein
MIEPDKLDDDMGQGVIAGSTVTTLLDQLERKAEGPSPDESDMLAELVLAMAQRLAHTPMDEVISVLAQLPGLSETTRAKLDRVAA